MSGNKGNKRYTSQNQTHIISFHETLKTDKVHCVNKYTSPLGTQCRGNQLPTSLKPFALELHELCKIFIRCRRQEVADKHTLAIDTINFVGAKATWIE